MKIIVFDGEFYEREVEWLKDEKPYETQEEWLTANDFYDFPSWSSPEIIEPRRGLRLHKNNKRDGVRLAMIGDIDGDILVLLEGDLSYVRFLASGICADVNIMEIWDEVASMRAIMARDFQMRHEHAAPESMLDHDVRRSCESCDPGFAEHRAQQREEILQARARRRTREKAKDKSQD